jgi:hypothetical protein
MSRRVVVEVRADLHKELRKIAVINDLKLHSLTNALLQECLSDQDQIKAVIKRLKT